MPAPTTVTAFITGQPVSVRLSAEAATALGVGANEVPLVSVQIIDGWFLATYQNSDGSTTRYLLPPNAILYAKQNQPASGGTPPQQG